MNVPTQKLHRGETIQVTKQPLRALHRWLFAAALAAAFATGSAKSASAQQYIPCPPENQPLARIPELAAVDNILRGTILLSDEQEAIPFRYPPQSKPGDPGSVIRCQPQYVRMLRGVNATPAPPSSTGQYPNPMPGPTLRARVGDIINLIFINEINPGHFGNSMDSGEKGQGCDKPVPGKDQFPDCFHGSSSGNIHFHGTHTNPNGTGDNVFMVVRPLPRDPQGNLATTAQQAEEGLDKFFAQCNERLKVSALIQWPKTWDDVPSNWTGRQESLLKKYDDQMFDLYKVPKTFWPTDKWQKEHGYWPQYYIGVFPYCYRLPEYTDTTYPPQMPVTTHMTHVGSPQMPRAGAGVAELNAEGVMTPEQQGMSPVLMMGQAPGTHWYHAHKHGSTTIDVANGMTGAFIIEGSYDDDLNNFYSPDWKQTQNLWTRKQPVMVINQLGVTPNLLRGGPPGTGGGGAGGIGATDKGPNFTINGQYQPVVNMRPNEVQMWRIVNTSGRGGLFFHPPNMSQMEWRQIAQDGVQFNETNYEQRRNRNFLLAAGNRADLLIQAKPCPGGAKTCQYPVIVQNEVDPSDLSSANNLTLLTINVSGDPVSTSTPAGQFIDKAPAFPAFLNDIADSEVTGAKRLTFSSTGPGQGAEHKIDGKKFDGEVGAVIQLNKVEEWKIENATYGPPISHPFHIHINPFQITEIFDPNEQLINPDTGKPYPQTKAFFDPQTNSPAVKYTFQNAKLLPGQCYLDPNNPNNWRPMAWNKSLRRCVPVTVPVVEAKSQKNIWWDVFPIPTGYAPKNAAKKDPKTGRPLPVLNAAGQPIQVPGYFKMRSRFVDYAGYYVLHCHILAHEDRGMMTVVEVVPAMTPYSHN